MPISIKIWSYFGAFILIRLIGKKVKEIRNLMNILNQALTQN